MVHLVPLAFISSIQLVSKIFLKMIAHVLISLLRKTERLEAMNDMICRGNELFADKKYQDAEMKYALEHGCCLRRKAGNGEEWAFGRIRAPLLTLSLIPHWST